MTNQLNQFADDNADFMYRNKYLMEIVKSWKHYMLILFVFDIVIGNYQQIIWNIIYLLVMLQSMCLKRPA